MVSAALISGITGQDGSYLAELLLDKGYNVWGIYRRSSSFNTGRIEHIRHRIHLVYGDVTDGENIKNVVHDFFHANLDADKHEIYNLAAQSHVQVSFEMPLYTANVDAIGTLNFLHAVHMLPSTQTIRFYQASTSELYGKAQEIPQKESTPFYPRSPYAVAKLAAYWYVVNYRESYGIHASNGILFNHEGPRRGHTFVTRKITTEIGKIYRRESDCLYLGNLDTKRDWGHAKDYVAAMWMMMQRDESGDFVIATGEQHTVREFVEKAFKYGLDVDITWRGHGLEEEGFDLKSGKTFVRIDRRYFRSTEVDTLLGDASKAKNVLGWTSTTTFQELIEEMVDTDLNAFVN